MSTFYFLVFRCKHCYLGFGKILQKENSSQMSPVLSKFYAFLSLKVTLLLRFHKSNIQSSKGKVFRGKWNSTPGWDFGGLILKKKRQILWCHLKSHTLQSPSNNVLGGCIRWEPVSPYEVPSWSSQVPQQRTALWSREVWLAWQRGEGVAVKFANPHGTDNWIIQWGPKAGFMLNSRSHYD